MSYEGKYVYLQNLKIEKNKHYIETIYKKDFYEKTYYVSPIDKP